MLESYRNYPQTCNIDTDNLLNQDIIIEILQEIRYVIFPGYFELKHLNGQSIEYHIGELLEDIQFRLRKQVAKALQHTEDNHPVETDRLEERAEEIVAAFLKKIPALREILATDVQAAYDGDPAAFNTDEVIISYPGVFAITVNRIAHELYLLGVPLIPRIMTEYTVERCVIDIHPGATIGSYFFIDHGTGVVVGETTQIGRGAKIYQGVTLGALSTRGGQSLRHTKRHPTLEDNVTVYSRRLHPGRRDGDRGGSGDRLQRLYHLFRAQRRPGQHQNPELQFKDQKEGPYCGWLSWARKAS